MTYKVRESSTAQQAFLEQEIWMLTRGGGFQRAKIYNKPVSEISKQEKLLLYRAVRAVISPMFERCYRTGGVSTDQHIENLKEIKVKIAASKASEILVENSLRFGIAQKLLNLYLKYKWCLGHCPPPPHCPFDRKVIDALGFDDPPRWTQFDDEKAYRELVRRAERKARVHSLSLPEWELIYFSTGRD